MGLLIVFILAIAYLWGNEISTPLSVKEIMPANKTHQDGRVLSLKVKGNYYLDDFLNEGGVNNDRELIDFSTRKITNGLLKLSIQQAKIACSFYTAQSENAETCFARNYDMKETHIALVETHPKNDYASISTVDLSFWA